LKQDFKLVGALPHLRLAKASRAGSLPPSAGVPAKSKDLEDKLKKIALPVLLVSAAIFVFCRNPVYAGIDLL